MEIELKPLQIWMDDSGDDDVIRLTEPVGNGSWKVEVLHDPHRIWTGMRDIGSNVIRDFYKLDESSIVAEILLKYDN